MKVRIKCGDMATIHIGIGHDDQLMIPKLAIFKCFWIFRCSNCYTQSRIHIPDLFIFIDLMLHCFFHVQDLTSQWKNSLETSVAALFGSTTGRITLNQV